MFELSAAATKIRDPIGDPAGLTVCLGQLICQPETYKIPA